MAWTIDDNARTAGGTIPYIPYDLYPPSDNGTAVDLYDEWGVNYPPQAAPAPNCTEAITILEEAEYELKELLKKTPSVVLPVIISGKTHQDQIVIALRSTQAALRALLKVG